MTAEPGQKVVEISHVTVRYGAFTALHDVSLDVTQGEYLGIIGPNGGGKTTLLRSILGLVPISAGSISICGKAPGKTGMLVGYVPQFANIDRSFPVTVREVVLTGRLTRSRLPFHRYSGADRAAADAALQEVGIGELASRQISGLSGGEFQRMLVARALAENPKILLLDEPTASVDAKSRRQIYDLLGELNRKMTILLVTHDMMAVSSRVHRLACLNGGLVYHGEPELDRNTVDALYGCPVDLIAHGVPHRVLKTHGEDR
ncbi:ABC transporter [Clostridium sp. W14A]|uniref:ABC transporter ATP-binding protein n=1 Tax=Caproicibacter fermentans TaxID=2576756 RepID=A0A7G8T9U3_9FIRM|nr:ABC transporter ATP-binding protein [Caproicibacter fermentans]OCN01904.1 ABC transporter [Clostridium sp. W14A]QNK40384.1 ABC transporter ATP-binding protein [Caproicibacter fermentans]